MALLEQNGPDLNETDVNSPRYTELSQEKNHPTIMGITGDADTLIGKGFERQFIAANMEMNVAAGDYAYMGNRVGMVTAVTKNVGTGRIETITVKEELGALPIEWRENGVAFGYDNQPNATSRTVVYAIGKDLAAEVINGAGAVLTTGSILICKARTTDKTTWTQEAQSVERFQQQFDPPAPAPESITISPEGNTNTGKNNTIQYSVVVLPNNASQDVVWSIESNDPPGTILPGNKVSIDQNGLVTVGRHGITVAYTVKVTSAENNLLFDTSLLTVDTD